MEVHELLRPLFRKADAGMPQSSANIHSKVILAGAFPHSAYSRQHVQLSVSMCLYDLCGCSPYVIVNLAGSPYTHYDCSSA